MSLFIYYYVRIVLNLTSDERESEHVRERVGWRQFDCIQMNEWMHFLFCCVYKLIGFECQDLWLCAFGGN